ncbi:uncharacterized protein [Nicotiana sylvestris]|uniref:uncharacterized protein n=1 Tax=Nicotiana sylvestris TaxID=4096 RepID=UPI00388CA24B
MAKFDKDEEEDDDEVNFLDVQRNLNLINDKDALTVELGEAEQFREDLVVVVVDLEETIERLKKEKDALTEKIANIGHERDDLVVVVVNLKETIECVRKKKEGTMKGSSQQWYMDSGCSKHMTGSTNDFLSLKALQGGSVSFGNGKKGYILGVGKIGKSLFHSIENAYYVKGLNDVNGQKIQNIYVANFESLQNGDLSCLSVVDDNAELWYRRLGHESFKLVKKDLVRGLPKSSFKDHRVCNACVKGKQVRSSFKPKKEVSISRPLDLLHMDLCGPIRVPNETSADIEEPDPSITIIETENRVVDIVHGTPAAEVRNRTHGSNPEEPRSSLKEIQVSNWKHKSSHHLQNIITPLDLGIQTRSKARNSLAFSAFLSQIDPKNIKEALKDADWITGIQEELHQFERNSVWNLVPQPTDRTVIGTRLSKFLLENGFTRGKIENTLFLKKQGKNLLIVQIYVDDIIFGATVDSLCEEFAKLIGSEFEMSMTDELNFFLGLQVKETPKGTMTSQQKYIVELLTRFDMEGSKIIDTPIATATRLDMDEPDSSMNERMYRVFNLIQRNLI